MEFLLPTTPVGILTVSTLLFFVIVQLLIDGMDIHRSKRIRKFNAKQHKMAGRKSFSVVIVADNKVETILPPLEHVYAQNDAAVEVIVELKRSAGTYASKKLATLRRRNHWAGMRIISYKKGQTHAAIIKRYARNDIVIELLADSRLAPNFFDMLRVDLMLHPGVSIAPRLQSNLDNSLRRAFTSHLEQWINIYRALFSHKRHATAFTPMVAYTRVSNSKEHVTISAYAATIFSSTAFEYPYAHTTKMHDIVSRRTLGILKAIISAGLISVLVIFLLQSDSQPENILFLVTIVVGYSLIYLVNMLRIKGFSLVDRVNLVLVSPFVILYGIATSIATLLMRATSMLHK